MAIEALTDYERGVTTTVGVISGGTAPNVIPQHCHISVDLRVRDDADLHDQRNGSVREHERASERGLYLDDRHWIADAGQCAVRQRFGLQPCGSEFAVFEHM